MTQQPRRHHIVPQLYLRRFARKERLVAIEVATRRILENQHIRNVAFESDAYRPDGLLVDCGINVEGEIAELESRLAVALREFPNEFPPSRELRMALTAARTSNFGAMPASRFGSHASQRRPPVRTPPTGVCSRTLWFHTWGVDCAPRTLPGPGSRRGRGRRDPRCSDRSCPRRTSCCHGLLEPPGDSRHGPQHDQDAEEPGADEEATAALDQDGPHRVVGRRPVALERRGREPRKDAGSDYRRDPSHYQIDTAGQYARDIVKSCGSLARASQAAYLPWRASSLASGLTARSCRTPSTKTPPARTTATRCGAFTRRQRCCAASSSL